MAGFIAVLRSGAWLTRERIRLVALLLLVCSRAGVVFVAATSDGLNDWRGRPLGTDFSNVYAAGTYVLDGEPTAPFDPRLQYAREQAIFGAAHRFLRLALPAVLPRPRRALALMPYALSLLVWQGVTLALYSCWAIADQSYPRSGRGGARDPPLAPARPRVSRR